uniref:Uncharacterized protein n=1 Tax=Glossina pallidipes TaxID=7398 RepID=A0A1B0AJ22_GLOPL
MKENAISCRQFADKGVNAGEYIEKKSAKFMVKLEPQIKSSSRKATKCSLQNFRLITKDDRIAKNAPETEDVYEAQCSGTSVQILEFYKNRNLTVKKPKAIVRQFGEDDRRRKFVICSPTFEYKENGGENADCGEQDEEEDKGSTLTRLAPAAPQQEEIGGLRGEEDSNQILPVDSRTLTHKHVKSSVPKQKVVEVTNYTEDITGSRNRKVVHCEKGIKKLEKSDYRLLPISLFNERFAKIDNLEKLVASIREEINRMREIFVQQHEDLLQFNELYERVRELNSMIIHLKSYDSSTSLESSNAAETSDLKNSSIKSKLEKREKREISSRGKVVADIEKKKGIPLTSFSAIDAAAIVAAAAFGLEAAGTRIFYPPKRYEAVISGIDKHNMTIYAYRYWVTSSIQ